MIPNLKNMVCLFDDMQQFTPYLFFAVDPGFGCAQTYHVSKSMTPNLKNMVCLFDDMQQFIPYLFFAVDSDFGCA